MTTTLAEAAGPKPDLPAMKMSSTRQILMNKLFKMNDLELKSGQSIDEEKDNSCTLIEECMVPVKPKVNPDIPPRKLPPPPPPVQPPQTSLAMFGQKNTKTIIQNEREVQPATSFFGNNENKPRTSFSVPSAKYRDVRFEEIGDRIVLMANRLPKIVDVCLAVKGKPRYLTVTGDDFIHMSIRLAQPR